jgi:hypothetical protein
MLRGFKTIAFEEAEDSRSEFKKSNLSLANVFAIFKIAIKFSFLRKNSHGYS